MAHELSGSMDDDLQGGALEDIQTEWDSRRALFWNSGYKDGLEEGKSATLQEGFDEGYPQGYTAGLNWGAAQGSAKIFNVLHKKHPGIFRKNDPKDDSTAVLRTSDGEAQALICGKLVQEAGHSSESDLLPLLDVRKAEELLKAQHAVSKWLDSLTSPNPQ